MIIFNQKVLFCHVFHFKANFCKIFTLSWTSRAGVQAAVAAAGQVWKHFGLFNIFFASSVQNFLPFIEFFWPLIEGEMLALASAVSSPDEEDSVCERNWQKFWTWIEKYVQYVGGSAFGLSMNRYKSIFVPFHADLILACCSSLDIGIKQGSSHGVWQNCLLTNVLKETSTFVGPPYFEDT